jgi:DNA modification methylase
MNETKNLQIIHLPISTLKMAEYNPRKHTKEALEQLTESLKRFGFCDPVLANSAPNRKNILIGGHFRIKAAKALGYKEVPVVYVNIPDEQKEKELNIRLNKNVGEFDYALLSEFDESLLADIGFSSEELDEIFGLESEPEMFDLNKELAKLDIKNISVQKGDIYELNGSRLMCGDSTVEADIIKLMGNEKADMCFTDPPYLLDYLKGKTKQKDGVTTGFGVKKNRRYLETDVLPDNFTELWMNNIAKIQKTDFSIIVFENPKNLKIIWNELEKHWKYRNTIVWHLPNRTQGFSAKHRFFNKHDIALVGTEGDIELNVDQEADSLLQQEYENALFAISGKPHWEGYEKGKKICPTDFISYKADDQKSSGQGIIFGTKPVEILIPYVKVLTKRDDIIIEPFGGSGSTLIAATAMKRRCFLMEKSPVYAQVILRRWEKTTGQKPKKINQPMLTKKI